ncbi:peregrin [Caerostris extrusa]|uniref:Peregrin n=1 Tax=Caerostris extrusa TaxID=172846 RepID=A0AAV4NWB0_CAEEX|nr:peregrin [Caerostris extrusa]
MDLSTMLQKVEEYKYTNFDDFENDFNLMIKNCLSYNSKDTVFYRAAIKMREQGGYLLREARKYIIANFNFKTGLLLNQDLKRVETRSNDTEENNKHENPSSLEKQLERVLHKLDEVHKLPLGVSRTRRMKRLRMEANVLRRKISIRAALSRKKKRLAANSQLAITESKSQPSDSKENVHSSNIKSKMKQEDSQAIVEPKIEKDFSKAKCHDDRDKSKSETDSPNNCRKKGKFKKDKRNDIPRSLTRNRAKKKEFSLDEQKSEEVKTEISSSDLQNKCKTRGKRKDSVFEGEDSNAIQSKVKIKDKDNDAITEKDKKLLRTPLRRAAKEGIHNMVFTDTDDDDKCSTDFTPTSPRKAIFYGRNLRNHAADSTDEQIDSSPRVGRPRKYKKCNPKLANKTLSPPPPSLSKSLKASSSTSESIVSQDSKIQKSPPAVSPSSKSLKINSPPVLKPQITVNHQDSNVEKNQNETNSTASVKKSQKSECSDKSPVTVRTRRSMAIRRESLKEISSEASEPETDKSSSEVKERETRTEGDSLKKKTSGLSNDPSSCLTQFSTSPVPQTDSFKVYRSNNQDHGTDSDDNNTESSSISTKSSSCSGTDDDSESDSDRERLHIGSKKDKSSNSLEFNAEEQQHLIKLQPLDLVWAKCGVTLGIQH